MKEYLDNNMKYVYANAGLQGVSFLLSIAILLMIITKV